MGNPLTELNALDTEQKTRRGLVYTPSEIAGQVDLWPDTLKRFQAQHGQMEAFVSRFKKERALSLLCTGAGTSEFVGHCIDGLIRKKMGIPTNVVSTTRIVTNPHDFLLAGYATLLISFARSGNSPESLGTVHMAEMLSEKIYHLVITCDAQGALYRETRDFSSHALVLDEKTNDGGLAMTGAFTNMVVAGQMLAHLYSLDDYRTQFDRLFQAGQAMLARAPETTREIAGLGCTRAVFLGDGSNVGTAVESHLKLQELTAGRVMCTWDSFPGLRHGPEAVVDDQTLVVAFLSNHGYARRYELDLLEEIREKKIGKAVLAVDHALNNEERKLCDYAIEYGPETEPVADDLIPPVYVIVGQLLGLFSSLQLGLKPDTPSESGVINRVVEGVKVYDPRVFEKEGKFQIIAER